MLATLVFALVTKMPDADFAAYGWRIPFLVSIVLLAVGTFVRSRVPETPVFEGLKMRDGLSEQPGRRSRRQEHQDIPDRRRPEALGGVLGLHAHGVRRRLRNHEARPAEANDARCRDVCGAARTVSLPLFGWLSDKIGRRPFYILGALFTIAFAFPAVLDAGEQEHGA